MDDVNKKSEFNERRLELIIKYGEKYGELIAVNDIAIGMNEEMITASIGKPNNIETIKTEEANGQSTVASTWTYDKKYIVFFENKLVVKINQ